MASESEGSEERARGYGGVANAVLWLSLSEKLIYGFR
jgi:hypothetical protein